MTERRVRSVWGHDGGGRRRGVRLKLEGGGE